MSRFMDGSASITMEELSACWDTWPYGEKLDFCNALAWMEEPPLSDVLRFVMKNGDEMLWRQAVALEIAVHLPASESVPFLLAACENSELGQGNNFFQALAHTDYENRLSVLRDRLEQLLATNQLDLEGKKGFNNLAP